MGWLDREELLIGTKGVSVLEKSRVAVIGLGGVGGAAAEALCRAGIGNLLLIDGDTFDESNLNRQILATRSVIGLGKVESAEDRFRQINPNLSITPLHAIYTADTWDLIAQWKPDYIVDAIDTITAKVALIRMASAEKIPVISSMGAGNRMDPEKLRVGTLEDTKGSGDGLSRAMRKILKEAVLPYLHVVYSVEPPAKVVAPNSSPGRHAPGSISFVPPVAGYLAAGKVVRDLLGKEDVHA